MANLNKYLPNLHEDRGEGNTLQLNFPGVKPEGYVVKTIAVYLRLWLHVLNNKKTCQKGERKVRR